LRLPDPTLQEWELRSAYSIRLCDHNQRNVIEILAFCGVMQKNVVALGRSPNEYRKFSPYNQYLPSVSSLTKDGAWTMWNIAQIVFIAGGIGVGCYPAA
jgi:hypothetical protein